MLKKSIDKTLLIQNESSLTRLFFTVILNAMSNLMYSSSTWQLNSYYFQENTIDRYLTEFKMFFSFL